MPVLIVVPPFGRKDFEFTPFFAKWIYKILPSDPELPTPLRAATLAANFLEKGYDCDILDLRTCIFMKVKKIISKYVRNYNWIVFTFSEFSDYPVTLKLSSICKSINPESKIVFEGSPSTSMYKQILNSNSVDYVVIGEGEKTLIDLISNKEESKILGLAFKKNNKIIKNQQGLPINLNLLPPPVWDKCKPIHFRYTEFLVESSRGCPMRCSFCYYSRWVSSVRFKYPKKVCDELENLEGENINFADLNFTTSEIHVKKICEEIKNRKLKFSIISAQSHIDFLNKEIIRTMKKAGFTTINIGVESLSLEILKKINKTRNPANYIKKGLNLIKYADSLGLEVIANYIILLPNQTKEKIYEEIKLLRKYSNINSFILTPYPETPEWDRLSDKLNIKDFSLFDGRHILFDENFSREDIRSIENLVFSPHLKIKTILRQLSLLRGINNFCPRGIKRYLYRYY